MTLMISYFATGLPYLDGDIGSPFTFIILCIIACIVIRKDMKKKKRISQTTYTKEELAALEKERLEYVAKQKERREESQTSRDLALYLITRDLEKYGKEHHQVDINIKWDYGSWDSFYEFLDSFDQNREDVKRVRELLSE